MRFSIATILAFAATAFAQTADFDPIYAPKADETIPAGSTYTVTWKAPAKYSQGTVKIELIGGATQGTQVKLADIASGVQNSAESFSWTLDASLGDKAVYGLVFRYESDPNIFQYSNPFHIKASGNQPSGSSSGSVTITTSHGTKTVTLSSLSTSTAPVTSTAAASSTSVPTTSAPATTSTHSKTIKYNTTLPANTTTLVVKTSSSQSAPVLITSTAVFKPTTAAPSTTAPSTIATPTAAANIVRVGSLTILGVVAAVLAL